MCTYSLLVFRSVFLLLGLLPTMILYYGILWGCWCPVPPLPSCLPIMCIPYTWQLLLSFHAYGYPSWLSYVWTSHPLLVFECRALKKNLFPSAGELGVIFLPSKLCLEVINTFPCFFPFWTFVSVFTLLSFHMVSFYFDFILVYLCIIVLVFFYLLWLFHIFKFSFSSAPSLLMVASF